MARNEHCAFRHSQQSGSEFLSCFLQPSSSTFPLSYSICLSGYMCVQLFQHLFWRLSNDDCVFNQLTVSLAKQLFSICFILDSLTLFDCFTLINSVMQPIKNLFSYSYEPLFVLGYMRFNGWQKQKSALMVAKVIVW